MDNGRVKMTIKLFLDNGFEIFLKCCLFKLMKTLFVRLFVSLSANGQQLV